MSNRLLSCLVVVIASSVASNVWATQWKIDSAKSTIGFAATFEGAGFDGRFRRYDAQIRFDPNNPSTSHFEVRIHMSSADTGSGDLNDGMMLPEWFNTEGFPFATFVTSNVQRQKEDRYLATGKLTIKGIEREVTLPFTWNQQHDGAVLRGETHLRRTDFRIGEGEWSAGSVVGIKVKVMADLSLRRKSP